MQTTTNQTPKWLDLFITAFGTQGLIALAWWAGAFHAQRIRELQATYPILQITGGPGVGKSTLVANLWKLAGSSEGDENLYADTCSMGALLAILVRTVNRPVVLEETSRGDERFDWSALRECYNGGAIVRHIGTDAIEGARFGGALAYVGGETEVLNSRIVNVHLPLQRRTAEGRDAVEALHKLQIADMANFVETIKANREQLAYRLGGVGRYIDSLQEDTEQRLPARIDRNHAQLLALLDLLLDLFNVPAETIHQARSEVWDMAWKHIPGHTDFAVFKVEPGNTN